MTDEVRTLGFGATFDTVADRIACGQVLSLTNHRGSGSTPSHAHSNGFLCVVVRGGFAEQQGGSWREHRAGCWFTHEPGGPHNDRFGPNGAVCVNVHSAEAASWSGSIARFCPPAARVAADRLAFHLASSCREELILSCLAAEIVAEIRPGPAGNGAGGGWIDKVVEAVSDEPGRRWQLGELARIADRHPVRLAQAFRARTGISLGAFQRLRRLTSLSLALRHGKMPLAALAAELGYCDQPHMTSEFRQAFGTSPGRYRRETR